MAGEKILLVEDESIVALDIRERLKSLGYNVLDILPTGEEAILSLQDDVPDLVLMDIKLSGEIDGIMAATEMRSQHDIPIVFLTAYADEPTLQRAKLAQPYGYLIKPFKERELYSTLELAFHKHKEERQHRENEERVFDSLQYIGDGVITTDRSSTITFMNTIAEKLTGWNAAEGVGRKLDDIFSIKMKKQAPVERLESSREPAGKSTSHFAILYTRDGNKIPIGVSYSPIYRRSKEKLGWVLVFYDFSQRKLEEQRYKSLIAELKKSIAQVKPQKGLIPICASCKKIRDPLGFWLQIEDFLTKQYRTEFSHSVCPDCTLRLYPEYEE